MECPYCHQLTYAEFVDVGVGSCGVQVTPYSCNDCQATEAGPYCNTSTPDYDPATGWFRQSQGDTTMHSSRTIFLAHQGVIAVRAYYDTPTRSEILKTFDTSIKEGAIVVAESGGKHGHSVLKVVEVGVQIDFDSNEPIRWITGKVDLAAYAEVQAQEAKLVDIANAAKAERLRKDVFGDVDPATAFEALPAPTPPASPDEA